MNRSCGIGVVLAVLVLFAVYAVLGVLYLPKFMNYMRSSFSGRHNTSAYAERLIPKTVPKAMTADTLAVFNFRHQGESDARLYAIGFARALADRINCAPKCVTQQPTVPELNSAICSCKSDFKVPITDAIAMKVGKKLYVRYILTGDLKLNGSNSSISACLTDLSAGDKKTTIKVDGALSDLPAMQSKIVAQLVQLMKLSAGSDESSELSKANFTKPDVLKLYGRSFLTDDMNETESCRWKAVQEDPNSLFAAIRLLEFYFYGQSTGPEIQSNARMQSFIVDVAKRYPDNSHVSIVRGLLLGKQFEYLQAQGVLEEVVRRDSGFARAHCALKWIAGLRQNGNLALREAKTFVRLWPNNADYHAWLAQAYSVAANNARHGHYYRDMSSSVENSWKMNSENCFKEAMVAIKLNRDCTEGWSQILSVSRELGFYKEMRLAFTEMIRINPRNINAYSDYAFCYSPQWGGTESQQEKILSQAEKVFGSDSVDMCLLHSWILGSDRDPSTVGNNRPLEEQQLLMHYAEEAEKKSKSPCEDVMLMKCRALLASKRRAEMYEVAKQGFEKWGSPTWRYLYGMGCAFRYENEHDIAALREAKEIYSKYTIEIPFDTRGYVQWGWCMSHLGQPAEAKKLFLKALEIDPANEAAKEKLKYVQ